jgi:hypothetical protein
MGCFISSGVKGVSWTGEGWLWIGLFYGERRGVLLITLRRAR